MRAYRWSEKLGAYQLVTKSPTFNWTAHQISHMKDVCIVPGAAPISWHVLWERERALAQASHVGPHTPAAPDQE